MKELWLERRVARQQQQDERDRDVILAWRIMQIKVKTQNDKRMPDLKSLLSREEPKDQLAIMYEISARHGLKMEVRPRHGR